MTLRDAIIHTLDVGHCEHDGHFTFILPDLRADSLEAPTALMEFIPDSRVVTPPHMQNVPLPIFDSAHIQISDKMEKNGGVLAILGGTDQDTYAYGGKTAKDPSTCTCSKGGLCAEHILLFFMELYMSALPISMHTQTVQRGS
ncbi:hypothetical protein Pelo_17987 [Pelomyxa schiedti]|nr:hypothetical protein Pelo_17987 [Pelomyxa schiedti]